MTDKQSEKYMEIDLELKNLLILQQQYTKGVVEVEGVVG